MKEFADFLEAHGGRREAVTDASIDMGAAFEAASSKPSTAMSRPPSARPKATEPSEISKPSCTSSPETFWPIHPLEIATSHLYAQGNAAFVPSGASGGQRSVHGNRAVRRGSWRSCAGCGRSRTELRRITVGADRGERRAVVRTDRQSQPERAERRLEQRADMGAVRLRDRLAAQVIAAHRVAGRQWIAAPAVAGRKPSIRLHRRAASGESEGGQRRWILGSASFLRSFFVAPGRVALAQRQNRLLRQYLAQPPFSQASVGVPDRRGTQSSGESGKSSRPAVPLRRSPDAAASQGDGPPLPGNPVVVAQA